MMSGKPANSPTLNEPSLVVSSMTSPLDRILQARAINVAYQPIVSLSTAEIVARGAGARTARRSLRRTGGTVRRSVPAGAHSGAGLDLPGLRDRGFQKGWAAQRPGAVRQLGTRGAWLPVSARSRACYGRGPPIVAGLGRNHGTEAGRHSRATGSRHRSGSPRPDRARARRCRGKSDERGHVSLVAPDVIKLDMSLVHSPLSLASVQIADAAQAEAERTGAAILAEGIESSHDVETAKALGATLGQGWLYGRPGPLPLSGSPRRRSP